MFPRTIKVPAASGMVRLQGLFEGLFGLNREADGDLCRTVENLEDLIAKQAAELTLGSRAGSQLDAAVARAAFGTGDVGLYHVLAICRAGERFSSPPVRHNQLTSGSTACPATIDLKNSLAGADQQGLEQRARTFVLGGRAGLFQPVR